MMACKISVLSKNDVSTYLGLLLQGPHLQHLDQYEPVLYKPPTHREHPKLVLKGPKVYAGSYVTPNKQDLYHTFVLIKSKKSTKLIPVSTCYLKEFDTSKDCVMSSKKRGRPKEEDLGVFDFSTILPPCNRLASDPKKVYPFRGVLPPDMRRDISVAVTVVMDHPPSAANDKTSFFLSTHVKFLKNKLTEDNVALLLYADCLLRLLKHTDKKQVLSVKKICTFSKELRNKILAQFTEDQGRSFPKWMRYKTVCYIIVCVLLANNLFVDIEPLSLSLKGCCSTSKLYRLIQAVGLTPVKRIKGVYKLQVPLPPLPPSMKTTKS